MIPKIFGGYRGKLVKIYEMLVVAETALPRTRILQASNMNPQTDNSLIFWLVDQGFLEKLADGDMGKLYMASLRRRSRSHKGLYKTTPKGRDVRKFYEALFDMLGLSEAVKERFNR